MSGDNEDDIFSELEELRSRWQAIRPRLGRRLELATEQETPTYASYASAVSQGRKAMSRFIPGDFFGDPAFDMMLDLFVAAEANKPQSVKACCIASRVPATTALRYLNHMEEAGLIRRRNDADDGRRVLVSLTPSAHDGMRAWLATISSIPLRRGLES